MAQAAPRNHRHVGAAGSEQGRQQQADAIADATGGVFVEHRPGQVVPAQDLAGVAQGQGELAALIDGHAAPGQGHGEGTDLAFAPVTAGDALGDDPQLFRIETLAVALAADQRRGRWRLHRGHPAASRAAVNSLNKVLAPMRKCAGVIHASPSRSAARPR